MVAVGTRISPRPPHRSRRALLTHRAPPSGSGVEAVTRQRVYSSDWRKEAGDELDEPLPAEAYRLAAPLERCEPEPLHLVEEPPQARVVSQRLALIFARSAIFIHALAIAIMASRYSGTEVRSSSAAHSSTWRLHSSIAFSGHARPSNCLISFYHTALIAQIRPLHLLDLPSKKWTGLSCF